MTKQIASHEITPGANVGDVLTTLPDGTAGWGASQGAGVFGPETLQYDTIDVTAYSGQSDAGLRLSIPAHVSGDEATHPSVLRFPDGWNGWRYWMAFTPYPGGSDVDEDPNIAVSQDGIHWETPTGFTNPLDNQGGGIYNSDTELVVSPDGLTLSCIWRTVTSTQEILYVRSTTDGIAWTAKTAILTVTKTAENILSPAILHDGTQWVMWTVDAVPAPNVMRRRTCATLTGTWSASTACTVTGLPAGRDLWHPSVVKLGSQYVCLMNDCTLGANGVDGELYLMRSTDQLAWTLNPTPVISQALAGKYDAVYRGCLVPVYGNGRLEFDMYHGAWLSGATPVWGMYLHRLSQRGTTTTPGITVQDENGTVATGVTQLDFQGANVNAAAGSGEVVVTVSSPATASSGEVLMQDGVTGPPVPIETEARDDWLYQG